MSEHARTDTGAIAAEQLLKHHANTGEVLTLLDLQRWFADELKRRPSTTTLAKARKAFQEAIKKPDPKTEEMRAFERAFAAAIAPYRLRAEEAERGEQDALKAADIAVASAGQALLVAQQRFEVLLADAVKKAVEAELMRTAAREATEKAMDNMSCSLDAANTDLSRALASAATSEAQRDGALAEAINLRQRLEDALALNTRNAEEHAVDIKAECARSANRELRSAEQMSETTKHWAAQVTTLRSELSELARKFAATETALLAEKADHERALAKARQHSNDAVSDEIKRLSDAVGGVNALHNTHVGAIRQRVEELSNAVTSLVRKIDAKTITEPTALQSRDSAGDRRE